MKREIIITSDGSKTIQLPDINEQYHSKHGAIQEAKHVFIKHGLTYFLENNQVNNCSILEIGFGTGLNAYLTALSSKNIQINYVGVEAYPVAIEEIAVLNYSNLIPDKSISFMEFHTKAWEIKHNISSNFLLQKRQQLFQDITDENIFNIIYFDAFGARVQPELWTEDIFLKMYKSLKKIGVLVTF